MCAQLLQSRLTPAAPWARVCQAPWCMRFSRQEYWNGASWRPLLLFSQTSNEKNMCVSLSQITHTHTALFTPSTTFDPAPFPQLRTRLHTPQRPHRLLHTRMSKLRHWTYNGHVWVSLWKTKLQAESLKQKCAKVTAQPWPQVLQWGGFRQGPLCH